MSGSPPHPAFPSSAPPVRALASAPLSMRRRLWLLAGVALCMLWTFPWQPKINNPNENVRFYMTAAIVEDGTYAIDGPWQRWGWVNDAALKDGHHYSVKAPLTSLLGVPAYGLYRGFCSVTGHAFARGEALWSVRLFASVLPFLLFLWLWLPWLGRRTHSPLLRDGVWLATGLGSLLYGYALLFVSHTLAASAAFGGLMLLSRTRGAPSAQRRNLFFAGLLAASVTAAEYPGVIVSVALSMLALATVRPWRGLLFFGAGAAVPTVAVMHFQWRAFGSPFSPGHLFLENATFRAVHHQGVFGADAFRLEAAHDLLFDPGFGLFPLTPLLLPGLVGLVSFVAVPRLTSAKAGGRAGVAVVRTAAAIALLTWLATATLSNWRGGWTLGPRYLATIVPFVAWAALEALNRAHRVAPRSTEAFTIGALATSLLASGLPSALYPHLPEAITRPLPELLLPMITGDYAPFNAGRWLGLHGSMSLLPMAVVTAALWASVVCAASWPQIAMPWTRKLRLAWPLWTRRIAGGALVAAILSAPLLAAPTDPKLVAAAAEARDFVLGHFSPIDAAHPQAEGVDTEPALHERRRHGGSDVEADGHRQRDR